MSILSLIVKREFLNKIRNKSFIIMTFVSPFLFVLFAVVIGYLSAMKSDVKRIGIHDESGLFLNSFLNDESYHYYDVTDVDKSILKDSVMTKAYDGVLYIPEFDDYKKYEKGVEYISEDSPSIGFLSNIERTLEIKLTRYNLTKAGYDTLQIDKAKANVSLVLSKSSGEETLRGLNEIKMIIGSAFGYMIMMFIIIYGTMVMRSVIEEKTNRIIEIIVSSVKPMQLMLGKILGTTLAGVLQFVIWAVVGAVLLMVVQNFLGLNTAVPSGELAAVSNPESISKLELYLKEILMLPIGSLVIYFFIFFIGGYFLYSSMYAAIGAAVDNETDTQQFMFPVIAPLMVGIYVGFFTVINDPNGTIATVFSMIPFTSPIVMLMRIPFGVPTWQIITSIVLLFATFIGIVWLAAKIYRIGILMYGKKPTWKEIFKWLKYQ